MLVYTINIIFYNDMPNLTNTTLNNEVTIYSNSVLITKLPFIKWKINIEHSKERLLPHIYSFNLNSF